VKWLKQNQLFVSFAVALLSITIGGMRSVSGMSDQAGRLARTNRDAESFVKDEAVDADSVLDREQINARLERTLASLEETFRYQRDEDLLKMVDNDPNRFQGALRSVQDELRGGGMKLPPNLGFSTKVPAKTEIHLAVWRLDIVRHVLRKARKFGVEEVLQKNGIKLHRLNLIDPNNYLEYARVEINLVGKSEALARLLHQLFLPGKYLTLEHAEINYQPLDKKNRVRGSVLPTLKLVVSALGLNSGRKLLRTVPDAESKKGSGRFYRKFK